MGVEGWIIFASFWALFVTTPGPNAVNCISVGMQQGMRGGIICVAAILTQATAFLILSAFGVTALIAASPAAFTVAKLVGATFLIWMGIRAWLRAGQLPPPPPSGRSIYLRALSIATINPKSVAGYLAAFTQFIQPDVPVWEQMGVIMPTALCLTALSYTGFTALGAGLGRAALGAVFNRQLQRGLAICFVLYGLALGFAQTPGRA